MDRALPRLLGDLDVSIGDEVTDYLFAVTESRKLRQLVDLFRAKGPVALGHRIDRMTRYQAQRLAIMAVVLLSEHVDIDDDEIN